MACEKNIFCGSSRKQDRKILGLVWLGDISTRQNGFIEFHQKAVMVNMPGGELSRILVLRLKCKLRRNETSYMAIARVNVHSDGTARMWTR